MQPLKTRLSHLIDAIYTKHQTKLAGAARAEEKLKVMVL